MALKPCRECNKKVSTEASTCPSCGVPNPTAKNKKIKDISSNQTYGVCEKIFCTKKYEIVIISKTTVGKKVCEKCGNNLQEVNSDDALKDFEWKSKNKDVVNISKNNGRYFFNGSETLAVTFWGYFIGGNVIFQTILVALSNNAEAGEAIIFLFVAYCIWIFLCVIGVFNSADIYKAKKIKAGELYGWATTAKVTSVILILSAIGNSLKYFR